MIRHANALSIAGLAVGAALLALMTQHARPAAGQDADVPALIGEYARAYGANAAVMLRVASCESKLGTHWRTNHPSNTHRGVFQFNAITWQELAPQIGVSGDFAEAHAAPSNVAVAAYAMALGQTWRWRGCL